MKKQLTATQVDQLLEGLEYCRCQTVDNGIGTIYDHDTTEEEDIQQIKDIDELIAIVTTWVDNKAEDTKAFSLINNLPSWAQTMTRELYRDVCSPSIADELVYEKALECNMSEQDAIEVSDAVGDILNNLYQGQDIYMLCSVAEKLGYMR